MTRRNTYDAIVIGAGQGGGPLAGSLVEAGWRTALVERRHVGGTFREGRRWILRATETWVSWTGQQGSPPGFPG